MSGVVELLSRLVAIDSVNPALVPGGAGEAGERTHPLLGRGSVHASMIDGGLELSSYPARCVVGLERRTLPWVSIADTETVARTLVATAQRLCA